MSADGRKPAGGGRPGRRGKPGRAPLADRPRRPPPRRPTGPRPPLRIPRGRNGRPSPARETALAVLLAAERTGRFVADVVHRQIEEARLSEPDRALVTELVNGLVRRRATVDAVIAAYSDTKVWRLDTRLLWVLRLAVYQMLCLTRVPARAAVDEAVRLARHYGLGWLCGFANGLLRTISRSLTPAGALADRVVGPRRVIPIDAERTVVTTRAVLPDPEKDQIGYLAAAFSYPEWAVARWLDRLGSDATRAFLLAGNERPRLFVRANRLRTTRDDLTGRLAAAGVETRPADHPDGLELLTPRSVSDLPGYAEGLFYVQDVSAMGVAPRLTPRPGERILDLAAAPGGKATHLAELMNNEGEVVASDLSDERLAAVAENVRRLGATIVRPVPPDEVTGKFDAALLDAPCTNTGVLARRAEARWRLSEEALRQAVLLQTDLIERAAGFVRAGGRLLYSTCSIEPEENRGVADAFLARHPEWTLVQDELILPNGMRDGGYVALFRK